MPATVLCLRDINVGVDYHMDDGRAIFDEAYPLDKGNYGNYPCDEMFILVNNTPVSLGTYFQNKLDEMTAMQLVA